MTLPLTPSQTIGPFWHFALTWPQNDAVSANAIAVEGQIVDGDQAPVGDAMVEIWYADAQGDYATRNGFVRIGTDREGRFRIAITKPGAVPGPGNAPQAPHLNVAIFARGIQKPLHTRMYFPDEPFNETDPVLGCIADAARRGTLIAEQDAPAVYRWRIVLQGDMETVFLAF
jgi:protocatechuate 3,4-dioxygenase alpha subunit